ncbi:glyoxylate/hydroxypyruvate reductase A [Amphritea opalescens]|uniref:Glyoxylate/hydroxypyruvate reductase A n=1 Tax=Amphritea opalescens TaxID=2490544 RepID=A0A430KS34_9GAMM|nr:glyoxylate/hydroxypyruvate reductase A [Amphritea opalescens]RTE66280.1 glyoxylate/hydroxypyruvate reductase A [Amphritea opalescens]
MSILLNNNGYDNQSWYQALTTALPEQTLYIYPETDNLDEVAHEIEYAVIWNHPPGDLQRYPNLKGILLLGAGTEHIDADKEVPNVPIVRLIDPEVIKDMGLYVLYWVMDQHRLYDTYRTQQQQATWCRHNICQPAAFNITILGLGAVGKAVANCLNVNGFSVTGWDAYPQQLDDIRCFNSTDQLPTALEQADVLVNCLPLNDSTQHFINNDLINQLPAGAMLINISRGDIVNDEALLSALDNGQLSRAVLDTFKIEPLPQSSCYWQHPKVTVTPHMSGATYARSAVKLIADNIRRIENGEQPFPMHQHPKTDSLR